MTTTSRARQIVRDRYSLLAAYLDEGDVYEAVAVTTAAGEIFHILDQLQGMCESGEADQQAGPSLEIWRRRVAELHTLLMRLGVDLEDQAMESAVTP